MHVVCGGDIAGTQAEGKEFQSAGGRLDLGDAYGGILRKVVVQDDESYQIGVVIGIRCAGLHVLQKYHPLSNGLGGPTAPFSLVIPAPMVNRFFYILMGGSAEYLKVNVEPWEDKFLLE